MKVLKEVYVTFLSIIITSMFCFFTGVDLPSCCGVTTYAGEGNASTVSTASEVSDMLVGRWDLTGVEVSGHPLEEVLSSETISFLRNGTFAMNCFGGVTWQLIDGDKTVEIKFPESETLVWIINAINAQTLVLEEGRDLFHYRRMEDCTNISNLRQMEMITLTGSVLRGNGQPTSPNKYGMYDAIIILYLNDVEDEANNPWGGVQTRIEENGNFEVDLVMSPDVDILDAEVYDSDNVRHGSFKFRLSPDHLSIGEIISTTGDIVVEIRVKGKCL